MSLIKDPMINSKKLVSYSSQLKDSQIKFLKYCGLFWAAVCMAQAVVFNVAVPFFIPFWAVMQKDYEKYRKVVFAGGILGASFISVGQALILLLQIIVFELLVRFKYLRFPMVVAVVLSVFTGQYLWRLISDGLSLTIEMWLFIAYEVILAGCMALFLRILFIPKNLFYIRWSQERIVAGFVFLAAVLIGLQPLMVLNVHIGTVLFQFLICIAAAVGGVSLAIVVATVIGTLIGMSELTLSGMIALYSLTGLVAGNFKKVGKIAIAFFSLIPSVVFYFYDATLPLEIVYFTSIVIGSVLFVFVPEELLDKMQAVLYPSHNETILERQKWTTNQVAKAVERFQQFTNFMKSTIEIQNNSNTKNKDGFVYQTCQQCYKYERCWTENSRIKDAVRSYEGAISTKKPREKRLTEQIIQTDCIKSDLFFQELQQKVYDRQLSNQLFHGRKMIAFHLTELTGQLQEVFVQLQGHHEVLEKMEDTIVKQLKEINMDCVQFDIMRENPGDRYFVCHLIYEGHPSSLLVNIREQLLPLLEEYFQEPFQLINYEFKEYPFKYVELRITSAQKFTLDYEIYSTPSAGTSGDTYSLFTIQENLVAIALSDGMGHDERARFASEEMLRLLKGNLQFNLQADTALHTLHYITALNYPQDMYATLDLLLLDLQNGELLSWKAGSVSTYILRGSKVIVLENDTGPVGQSLDFKMESQRFKVMAGDVIFVVSDGIFNNQHSWVEQEQDFIQCIKRNYDRDWSLSSVLVEMMNDYRSKYEIEDDCTLIACKIDHVYNEWFAIRNS